MRDPPSPPKVITFLKSDQSPSISDHFHKICQSTRFLLTVCSCLQLKSPLRNKSEHNSDWGHCISIGLRSQRQYAACKLCAHMLLDCCWHPTQPYWALKSSGHVVMGSRIVSPDQGVEKGHKWCTLVQRNPERRRAFSIPVTNCQDYDQWFWETDDDMENL